MHDELTAKDIEKMQEELDHRRIELRPPGPDGAGAREAKAAERPKWVFRRLFCARSFLPGF